MANEATAANPTSTESAAFWRLFRRGLPVRERLAGFPWGPAVLGRVLEVSPDVAEEAITEVLDSGVGGAFAAAIASGRHPALSGDPPYAAAVVLSVCAAAAESQPGAWPPGQGEKLQMAERLCRGFSAAKALLVLGKPAELFGSEEGDREEEADPGEGLRAALLPLVAAGVPARRRVEHLSPWGERALEKALRNSHGLLTEEGLEAALDGIGREIAGEILAGGHGVLARNPGFAAWAVLSFCASQAMRPGRSWGGAREFCAAASHPRFLENYVVELRRLGGGPDSKR